MKKHLKSRAFKILTFIVCLVMTAMACGINTFAVSTTQTNSNCPYPLCSKKLIISGPYGADISTVDSSVPYLGGKTYSTIYNEIINTSGTYRDLYHLFVVYCPSYNNSSSSYFRHNMSLILPEHGYTVTGYEKYNGGQHYTSYICDHGQISSSSSGSTSYTLNQTLCGERATLSNDVISSLMSTYNSSGCGKTKKVLENHEWTYGAWVSKDSFYHTRTGVCNMCGETNPQTALHSTATSSWTSINSTQHQRTTSCSECNYSSIEKVNHSWTYSNYTSVDGTKHSAKRTCSICGYSDTVQQNHTLTYSDWREYVQSSQSNLDSNAPESTRYHVRTVTCSDCGYTAYEYEEHNHVREFEGYLPSTTGTYAGRFHYYRVRCTKCTHGITYYSPHSYNKNQNVYTDLSDTQHHIKQTCTDCGWLNEFDENHKFKTTWEVVSETRHKKTDSCVCGHINTSYGDHHDDDSDCYCDDCGYLMTRFSVTVPATLSLVMDKDGKVYTPTNAEITNNSTAAVKVMGISLTPKNGWTVVPYSTNMANQKVDSHKIGLKLRDSKSTSGNTMSVTGNWEISKGSNLPLTYSAVVSATSQPITGSNVLDVTFVIDWRD